MIAAQPPQLQAALITNVSEYLANERMVHLSAKELSAQLMSRVSETAQRHLRHATENQWANRVADVAAAATSPGVA